MINIFNKILILSAIITMVSCAGFQESHKKFNNFLDKTNEKIEKNEVLNSPQQGNERRRTKDCLSCSN
jgi:hypothetical protein